MRKTSDTRSFYFLKLLGLTLSPFIWTNLVLLLCLAVSGVLVTRLVAFKIEQEFFWNVATEVARRLPKLEELKAAASPPEVLTQLAVVNKELEAYVLDGNGRIVYPQGRFARQTLALGPILAAVRDELPVPPVFADDPQDASKQTLFAASPLLHAEKGYVFLVIRSRLLAATDPLLGKFRYLWMLFLRFLPPLLFCLILGIGFTLYVTRSFRKVVSLLRTYAAGNFTAEWKSRAQDNISQTARKIQEVARRADEQSRLSQSRQTKRKALLLDLIHDVRGPLTGMRAAVETLSTDSIILGKPLAPDLLEALSLGSASVLKLSSALQNVSTLELPKEGLNRQEFPLSGLLQSALAQMRPKAQRQGVDLVLDLDSDRASVFADALLLERVLLNLIDNAIRHTPAGGSVRLHAYRKASTAAFEVSDTGVGIPNEELPFIFDSFFRGRAQQLTEGAGVGLATAKRILELHVSEIRVESKLHQGTRFRFQIDDEPARIPAAQGSAHDSSIHIANSSPSRKFRLSKREVSLALSGLFCAGLIQFGIPCSTNFLSVSLFGLIGIWTTVLFLRIPSLLFRLTAVVPTIVAFAVWCSDVRIFYFPLLAAFLGSWFAIRYFRLTRSASGSGAFTRAAFLALMINAAGIGWAVFIFHATAEEEVARHVKGAERTYAQQAMPELESIFCPIDQNDDPGSALRRASRLSDFAALNSKQMVFVTTIDGVPQLVSTAAAPDSGSFLSRLLFEPHSPYFVRLPLSRCDGKLVVTFVFQSPLHFEAFNKLINRYDILFFFFPTVLVAAALRSPFSRRFAPFDSVMAAVQAAISEVTPDTKARPANSSVDPLAQPLVDDVYRLIAQFHATKGEAEQADRELAGLARLAAREYGEFAAVLTQLIDRLAYTARPGESGGSKETGRLIRNLENILEPQIALTRALFSLARKTLIKPAVRNETEAVELSEVFEDVLNELIGYSDLLSVTLHSAGGSAAVYGEKESLSLTIICLVQGLMKLARKESQLEISFGQAEHLSQMICRFEPAAEFEGVFAEGTDAASERIEQLLLPMMVAAELAEEMGAHSKCTRAASREVEWELSLTRPQHRSAAGYKDHQGPGTERALK